MNAAARRLDGVANAPKVVFGAVANAATPREVRSVVQWAEDDRYVGAESGSSRPGKWRNATTPYAIEPMECLDSSHPSRSVVVMAAAQMLKSEVPLNWIGQTICDDPASMLMVLPSLEELRSWNATKWQPTVDATPTLRGKVLDLVERGRTGSTTSMKRFRGGFLMVTTAISSKGLQARSIKRLICDEVSEFPADAGGRGDPIKQAQTRGDGHADFKGYYGSTPKNLPDCRITTMYERGDMRRFYVACPHCDCRQVLLFERMRPAAASSERIVYQCAGCAEDIEEIHKLAMIAGGVWLKTYEDRDPDDRYSTVNEANPAPPLAFPGAHLERWKARGSAGREPSFHIWQAYSPFKAWSLLWAEHEEAKKDVATGKDPEAMRTFTQQKLGEAYDPAVEAPPHVKLFEKRGGYVRRGLVPAWACEVVGVADVQGDRIEWDAYAIGPDLSMARFEWGVIERDPVTDPEAWSELAEVVSRRFEGEATVPLGFDQFGVDLGGKKGVTEKVYRFVRGRHNVVAVKGASDPDAIPLVKGKRKRIPLKDGTSLTIQPHLIGGYGLKTAIYSMLRVSLDCTDETGRLSGGLYNPADATHEDFKQYVAEVFKKPKTLRSSAKGWWERIPGQANERLDLAVYARGLFWFLGAFRRSPAEWQTLFEKRAKRPEDVLPLFETHIDDQAEEAQPVPAARTADNPGAEKRGWHSTRSKL